MKLWNQKSSLKNIYKKVKFWCYEPMNEARSLNLSSEAYSGQAVVKWSLINSQIIKHYLLSKYKKSKKRIYYIIMILIDLPTGQTAGSISLYNI